MAQKKEKKNNHEYIGHFVPQQRLRALHALRSDQLLLSYDVHFMNLDSEGLRIAGKIGVICLCLVMMALPMNIALGPVNDKTLGRLSFKTKGSETINLV